jgi:hypothetical protein
MVMLSYLTPISHHQGIPASNGYGYNNQFVHQPQQSFVNEPTSFDVLLGKEKAIFNHSGNISFRQLINQNLDKYIEAPTKSSKSKLIRQVHADMQKSGFRFLRRNEATGVWLEIEKHEAREKVSHALRDRVREQQKPTKRKRKSSICSNPASPTSVLVDLEQSPPEEKPKTIQAKKQKREKKQKPMNIPTLCQDDLGVNQPFSKNFFDLMSCSKNNYGTPFNAQRRISLLSKDGDDTPFMAQRHPGLSISDYVESSYKTPRRPSILSGHVRDTPFTAQRRLSILNDTNAHIKTNRRLSISSIIDAADDVIPFKAQRRMSWLNCEDMSTTKALRRLSLLSVDDMPPARALRHLSMMSTVDGFADSEYTDKVLEPYSLDDEFELLELDHDFSTHLDENEGDFDAFHHMPIREVLDESMAAQLVKIACAL